MFYTWNQTDRVIRTKTATEMTFAKEIGIVLVVFVNIVVENNIKLFILFYFDWDILEH